MAMACAAYQHDIDPGRLNEEYRNVGGFVGANLIIRMINNIYPDMRQRELVPCMDTPAPLSLINESLAMGDQVIVQVDSSPNPGHQEHWVVITAKLDGDYVILDPWDMQPSNLTLTEKYPHPSSDSARIITSVLVIAGTSIKHDDAPIDDGYNATVIAKAGGTLRSVPGLGDGTILAYLVAGTRLTVPIGEAFVHDGLIWHPVICYMAEAAADGTPILARDVVG